jgi:uncharacterized small protein (DUF1192 family)
MPHPIIDIIKAQEKLFDETFEKETVADRTFIKHLHRQSLIAILQSEIERLEGEKIKEVRSVRTNVEDWNLAIGWNEAITTQITHLTNLIQGLKEQG